MLLAKTSETSEGSHLCERGPLPLRLDGDGLSAPLKYLIDVFLAELGALVFFVHQSSVRALFQQILHFQFGELLHLQHGNTIVTSYTSGGALKLWPDGHAEGFHPVEAPFAVDVLKDGFVQPQFQTGLVEHLPLVRVPGDQPVDFHRLALTDPVAASLRLRQETHKTSPGHANLVCLLAKYLIPLDGF